MSRQPLRSAVTRGEEQARPAAAPGSHAETTTAVGLPVRGPTRPAGQVFVPEPVIRPFVDLAASEYQALSDYLAGRISVFPGAWAVLVGRRVEGGFEVVRLARADSVRATDPGIRSEFDDNIVPRFGPAYANEARGFWCDSRELLRITRAADADDLEVLGAIHFHSDWHRIGPANERGLHLSEYPTPMDQYMIHNTCWPVHMICYLERRGSHLYCALGAWGPPENSGDGHCLQLSVLVSV